MPMTIRCPHCDAEYALPESLLGPGGSRVRCPGCQGQFLVGPTGEVRVAPAPAVAEPPAAPSPPVAPPVAVAEPEGTREERIARMVLEEVALVSGRAIEDAAARGRVFAEHGPALLEAWDEYRRRVGKGADPAPFRAALRARWGIDLPEPGGA
jgi:predicted Zn finger-like uncharacterized protein